MGTFGAPIWLDNPPAGYTARADRHVLGATFPNAGVLGPTELKVSQRAAGANSSVDVAIGRGVVKELNSTDSLGWRSYLVDHSGSLTNLSLPAAPATGSRYDMIVAKLLDDTTTGGGNTVFLTYQSGASSGGTPTEPTLPLQSTLLARVTRTAGEAAVFDAAIQDRRVNLFGWNSYTPLWTTTGSAPNIGTDGYLIGRWRYISVKQVAVEMRMKLGTSTSGANGGTGFYRWSLPFNASAEAITNSSMGSAQLRDISGVQYPGATKIISATTFEMSVHGISAVTEAAPVGIYYEDEFKFKLDYEIA